MFYKKKPVLVEAVLAPSDEGLMAESLRDFARLGGFGAQMENEGALSPRSPGDFMVGMPDRSFLRVRPGCYLIKGPGGLFTMEADLFEAAYEPVEETKKKGKRR